MNRAIPMQPEKTDHGQDERKNSLPLIFIVQSTCYIGGAVLTATGVIASLISLFLYHPATSLFRAETIAIYLLQTIAGFAAVGTAHYLNYHNTQTIRDKQQPTQKDTDKKNRSDTTPT